MFTAVDLFAGAGGLSLGFMQTNEFEIKAAFENSPYMQETYRRNHPGVEVQGDVCKADYEEIRRKYGEIDVVIGGPPCQGFSNANRQKNTAISKNNMLVKQYIRAILELRPKAFVMENVSMLRSEVHRFYMEESDVETVKKCGIPVKLTKLPLIEEEFVFDGALQIIQSKRAIEQYIWPEEDYFELNIIYKAARNPAKMKAALEKHKSRLIKCAEPHLNSDDNDHVSLEARKAFNAVIGYYKKPVPAKVLQKAIEPSIMIQRMLSKALEIYENNIVVDSYDCSNGISANIRSFAVFDYLRGIVESEENGYVIDSRVLCAADYGAPQKRMRFVIIGIRKSIKQSISLPTGDYTPLNYRTVRDAISDLQDVQPVVDLKDDTGIPIDPADGIGELAKGLRNASVLRNHIVTKTTETALERFRVIEPGKNFHSLDISMKTNTYTDADRTQNTIYLRLSYDEPSGTVVNVRKSMWIHPVLDRAISVREAARLQSFPDSFVFYGSKDKQYQQVGNAVPPIMAKAIAEHLAKILKDNPDK